MKRTGISAFVLLATLGFAGESNAAPRCPWQAAWGSSQMLAEGANALPKAQLANATLRQIVRPSIAGDSVRVRVSNAFSKTPLTIAHATIARSAGNPGADIVAGSARPLRFAGAEGIVVPPGGEWLSDAIDFAVRPFDDVAISLHIASVPDEQTSHPGSRATSYVVPGDATAAATLGNASAVEHWYLLSGLEVASCANRPGIVVLGDSITDGRGSTTDCNDRWTDALARRLGGRVAVINQGIGGNRVLLDGLGPNALARLDRDVLGLAGVGHLIVLEGVNDIGTLSRETGATTAQFAALVERLKGAYLQIATRARSHGMKVHVATIMPFMGSDYYHGAGGADAARQALNQWIRTSGRFDGVIDFDRAMRDPARPAYLNPAFDTGDGLHPNPAGYRAMAQVIEVSAFD